MRECSDGASSADDGDDPPVMGDACSRARARRTLRVLTAMMPDDGCPGGLGHRGIAHTEPKNYRYCNSSTVLCPFL